MAELLSRNYSTPVKKLQHSCQEITALLSRNYSSSVKKLQHSCEEITALLSRNYSTPVKRLQHSCQEIAALLSRDYGTPVKRLQRSCQEITALLSRDYSTVSKMIEYLNFFLLSTLVTLLCYLYVRTKRYINLFKMAEDNINFIVSNDPPKPDLKRQKLLKCVLTRNSKPYLGKVHTEEKINKLSEEEVDKLFIIMKLSSQIIW